MIFIKLICWLVVLLSGFLVEGAGALKFVQEVDLHTGRCRHSCRIGTTIMCMTEGDTAASRLLQETLQNNQAAEWTVTNVREPLSGRRPTYLAHGALLGINRLAEDYGALQLSRKTAASGVRKALDMLLEGDVPTIETDLQSLSVRILSGATDAVIWQAKSERGGGS